MIVVGELGLAGEIRAATELDKRLREAERLGFSSAAVPSRNYQKGAKVGQTSIETRKMSSIFEAIRIFNK